MHFELWPQFPDFARFLCAFGLKADDFVSSLEEFRASLRGVFRRNKRTKGPCF